jgi:hypothetical protein
MSEWVKHDGKGCPVDGDDRYLQTITHHANGEMSLAQFIAWSRSWQWKGRRNPDGWDIIAYQVVKTYKPQETTGDKI